MSKSSFRDLLHEKIQAIRSLILNPVSAKRFFGLALNLIALLIFLWTLIHYLDYFIGKCTWNIFGGWDARYFWNLKAKFYSRSPADWQGMFSPLLAWSHPEYPLLLPGTVAWGWLTFGRELLIWPALVALAFTLSLSFLVTWYLASYAALWVGFLGGAFVLSIDMYRFWSTTLYADIPLAVFITAGGIMLSLAFRHQATRLFVFSGILTGLSIWTKDEGIFFAGWTILLLAGNLLSRTQEIPRILRLKRFAFFILAVALPFAASLAIKYVFCDTGGAYLRSGRSFADLLRLFFAQPEKTHFIAACFGFFLIQTERWNGLWIFFLIALCLGGKKMLRDGQWVLLALPLEILFGYFLIMHISPHDLRWQIETALLRIMSHAGGLAAIFALHTLTGCFTGVSNSKQPSLPEPRS